MHSISKLYAKRDTLRKKGIFIAIDCALSNLGVYKYYCTFVNVDFKPRDLADTNSYDTPELALQAGITLVINYLTYGYATSIHNDSRRGNGDSSNHEDSEK